MTSSNIACTINNQTSKVVCVLQSLFEGAVRLQFQLFAPHHFFGSLRDIKTVINCFSSPALALKLNASF